MYFLNSENIKIVVMIPPIFTLYYVGYIVLDC